MSTAKTRRKCLLSCLAACLALALRADASAQVAQPQQALQPARGKTYTNSIGMEFVRIPRGTFNMGQAGRIGCRHVTISRPFYMGKYEVTQAQWQAVMGSNPSRVVGANRPVHYVSWEDVQTFILRLNRKEGVQRYRLPTEAEWEYVAQGKEDASYNCGETVYLRSGLRARYGKPPFPVGSDAELNNSGRPRNGYGVYDMEGNVMEWVWDWYGDVAQGTCFWDYKRVNSYGYDACGCTPRHPKDPSNNSDPYFLTPESRKDPTGPRTGQERIFRGWGYSSGGRNSEPFESYFRGGRSEPHARTADLGFRLVRDPD